MRDAEVAQVVDGFRHGTTFTDTAILAWARLYTISIAVLKGFLARVPAGW